MTSFADGSPVGLRPSPLTKKKRLWMGVGILLSIVLIALLAIPESRLTCLGYLRGENRFQGRPTSYWRYKVELYASQNQNSPTARISLWDKVLKFLSLTRSHARPDKPALLEGKAEALPVLADLIREKASLPVTCEAYIALGTLGRPSAKDVLPLLEEEISGQDIYFRPFAVRTLGSLGPEGVQHLIRGLKHEGPDVRIAAAETLYQMALGPEDTMTKEAVPALIGALEDKVDTVRLAAAHALVKIDPEEAEKVHAEKIILDSLGLPAK
jgi:HEAT repeats